MGNTNAGWLRVRAVRVLRYGAVFLIGVVLGTWLGAWAEQLRHEYLGFSEAVGRSFLLSQHAELQYCEANDDAASEALLAWLAHLEATERERGQSRDPLMTSRGIATDKTIALGRLAMLEERGGRPDLADKYWQRAAEEARAAAWSDVAPDGIRAAVERLDPCRWMTARETPLRPGPFMGLRGAELGPTVSFDNEVDSHECHELTVDGRHVAWLNRAYAFSGHVFAQRCEEYDLMNAPDAGRRLGGVESIWHEVVTNGDNAQLEFERLDIPDWSFISNPTFCQAQVAYWGWRDGHLVPSIYDLGVAHRTAAQDLGAVDLGTDDASYFPAPVWDRSCRGARFDASVVARGSLRLPSDR